MTEPAMRCVADMLAMAYIRVYEVATFYTMFQLAPVGAKAHVQVCGTTPCMLRGSGDLIRVCKERIAEHAHELSEDGAFSWEEVECLGSCANAPMIQIGSDTFEDLTPELMHRVLDGFAKGKPPHPGSQIGRVASCPATGPTTLSEWTKGLSGIVTASSVEPEQVAFGHRGARREQPADAVPGAVGSGLATSHMVVGDEAVGEILQPALLAAPRNSKADDLKLIDGIGPILEKMLNKLGIWHFDQIAAWNEKHVKWIDQQLEDFRGRVERDKWVEQARKLASGARSKG